METEIKMKYMLEEITKLNELIRVGRESEKERDSLRNELAELMDIYTETLNERRI